MTIRVRAAPPPLAGGGEAAMLCRLALAPAICLGIARFAYALILPDMRADLGWSYAEAGAMNTSNAAGYLAGALLAASAMRRLGEHRTMTAGIGACILALGLCALVRDPVALNLARALAGLGGGLAFVAAGVLAAAVAHCVPARSGFLIGVFYAGPGLGILSSGVTVPLVLDAWGGAAWPSAWAALATLSLLMALGLPRAPRREATGPAAGGGRPALAAMGWLLGAYLLFGAGYIAFMTFMVAWVQAGGGGAGFQAAFWMTIGLAAMASPWLWARVLDRLRHGHAFSLLTAVTMAGAALPLLSEAPVAVFASAALFGSAFFAVVAATTVFVRRNQARPAWPAAIGALTVAFGLGQTAGPVAVGLVNDLPWGLGAGLWASVGLLGLASLVGAAQRDLAAPEAASGH